MRGNGTSMISLLIPAKGQISLVNRMLTEEYGTASNIKSRVNRLSVLSAVTSVQQRLKLYNRTPPNGLVIYCGTVLMEDHKEKKVNIDFEPFRPLNKSLYLCDSRFHTEPLAELLDQDDKFGFIVIDGNGALFATLAGNHRKIINQFSVELPKKHGRGGQSALRFARLRLEARHNYLRKVCEYANNCFLTDSKPNIKGIIVGGSAELKNQLAESEMLSSILRELILKLVDVSYGGHNGLNQTITGAADTLANVKFVQEKKQISQFFEQISQNTGLYCFGIKDTMTALEMGAIKQLLLWEDYPLKRYQLYHPVKQENEVIYQDPDKLDLAKFQDTDTGVKLEIKEEELLVDWLSVNYQQFGTELSFITERSAEGSQFCKGFGGIGGMLRWAVDFDVYQEEEDDFL